MDYLEDFKRIYNVKHICIPLNQIQKINGKSPGANSFWANNKCKHWQVKPNSQ